MVRRSVVLAALLSMLCACASHPSKHIYVLNEAVESAPNADGATRNFVLLLKHVRVPDYLDTTDIRVRVGEHELKSSSTARWAERLSLGITHALRADLATRLPVYSVSLSGPPEKAARVVLTNVETLEVWPNGHCVLAANWSILDADSRAVLTTGRNTFNVPPVAGSHSEDDKIVACLAEAVRRLAESIASSESLHPRSPAAQ